MAWQQLHLIIPSDKAEKFEDALLQLGACSITFVDAHDEPIFEPDIGTTPLWSTSKLTALFELDKDLKRIGLILEKKFPKVISSSEIEYVKDQAWERVWLEYFKPLKFGDNLWICPTDGEIPDPTAVNIFLDPGLAFGTGTHPTTALCLEWLATHNLKNKTLIDYGCGSGILAIAALKLGIEKAWGIDHDPQALTASKNNAERNDINLDNFHVAISDEATSDLVVDIVVANILAKPLITLAPILAHHVKVGGSIVLSGILANQAEEVVEAYAPYFNLNPITQKEDWIRIDGVRN